MDFPLISVVIPVYNQARYLSEAIESVLQQTYPHIEIIVVDDGSTDAISPLKAYYCSLPHPFSIHWIEQSNQGPSQARNEGIKRAAGSYICLLDSDDRMHPERITLQYQAFSQSSDISIVYTAVTLIDEHGKIIGDVRGKNYCKEDFLAFMLFRNVIPNPNTIMAKAICFKNHVYNSTFIHAEDYELMTRLAEHFYFYYLDLPLNFYRRHSSNLSNNLKAHREAELKVVSRYNASYIEGIIAQTSLSADEKLFLKGCIFFNQEQIPSALACFHTLSSSSALFYEGNCYLSLNQPKKALDVYLKAVQRNNHNPACYNNIGVVYGLLNRLEEAKKYFQHALSLNPLYRDPLTNLQETLVDSPQWQITWREIRPSIIPYTRDL